jgi:hypothetical protein
MTTTKTGQRTPFSIAGLTLRNLIHPMHQHIDQPAQFLIRYSKQPSQCLTSERIAKSSSLCCACFLTSPHPPSVVGSGKLHGAENASPSELNSRQDHNNF